MFAATIQFHDGAYRMMKGIGKATSQPQIKTRRRPTLSDKRPDTKFIAPLTKPKLMTNAISNTAESAGTPNSDSARTGTTVRCMPIVKPTKKTCNNCCAN